jgi:basic membrane protein A
MKGTSVVLHKLWSKSRAFATLATIGVASLALTACGGMPPNLPAEDGGLNVGILVDNAFGDGDFFDQASLAEKPLEDEFNASVSTYEGQLEAQNFKPLFQDAADRNDIVFVLGFEVIDSMNAAAAENPDTTFVFIDGDAGSDDVVSAVFRTQEGCFMAGALAATVSQEHDAERNGYVGGVNSPVVKNCESGYKQGVENVDDKQDVISQYVGSFVDPSKGSEIAKSLAATRGVHSIFAYAGLSGSGVFDAAKAGTDIAPIGVVADKSSLAPGKVPGSLVMGVDNVILDMTKRYLNDDLKKGSVEDFGFKEGGWDMVYDKKLVGDENVNKLDKLQQDVADGKVTVDE